MLKHPALTVAALVLLVGPPLSGCALEEGNAAASLEPRAELGQKAALAAASQGPRRSASGGKSAATVDSEAPAEADGVELGTVEDEVGDHGDAPRYADLTEVVLTDSDEGLGVSVVLGAVVPGWLGRGEIEDVGVDIYRVSPLDAFLGEARSDFQVRLDGGAYGWRAFLRTPEGYVGFPGTFTARGRTLQVVLPWEAVGGRTRAEVEVFVDWSSGVGRLSTDGARRVPLVPR